MKKLLLTALLAIITANLAHSQSEVTETNRLSNVDIYFGNLVHDHVAFNGKGSIYYYEYNDNYTQKKITFYNDDIQETASITIDGYSDNYTIYKYRETDASGNCTGKWIEEKHDSDLDFETDFDCYDSALSGDYNLSFSQTLFNNDEKYEYLVPIFDKFEIKYVYEYDRDSDGEIDIIEEEYSASYIGFDVKNQDGNVVCSIRPKLSNGFKLSHTIWLQVLGGKKYLVLEGENEDYSEWEYIYILINPNNSSVQQVAEPIHTSVFPTIPRHNDIINVELEGNDKPGEIVVTNTNGQTVYKKKVVAGERRVQIDSRRLSTGLNIINVNTGNSKQNFKVIVK